MFKHTVKQRIAARSQAMAVMCKHVYTESLRFVIKLAGSATLHILTATSPATQTVTVGLSLLTRQPDMC